jgi:DNA repair protein RadC
MMTIFKPVGKEGPVSTEHRGFVPRDAEDAIARELLRPQFADNRESMILAGFDAFGRLTCLERVDSGTPRRCAVPPRCWRALIGERTVAAVMAHNHPSGTPWPSDADIAATHDSALFLRTAEVDLIDHLIFVADGHFSFRTAEML